MSTDIEHVNQEYPDIIEQPNIADITWGIAKIDNLSDIKKTKLYQNVLDKFYDANLIGGDSNEKEKD